MKILLNCALLLLFITQLPPLTLSRFTLAAQDSANKIVLKKRVTTKFKDEPAVQSSTAAAVASSPDGLEQDLITVTKVVEQVGG